MIPGNLYDSGVRVRIDVNLIVHDAKCLRLYLSAKTVGNHVSNIFSKLQVADRTQAIIRAREAGLGRGA